MVICRKAEGQKIYEKRERLTAIRIPVPAYSILKIGSYFFLTLVICLYLLVKNKIDVVYERGRIYGGPGVLAAWICHVKSIYEINEPYYEIPVLLGEKSESSFFFKSARWWHFFIVRKAAMLTVTYDSLITRGVVPRKKTYVTSTGVNTRLFFPSPSSITKKYHLAGKCVVLYVGSFAPWHACEKIIKAMEKVCKENKKIVCMMVGGGGRLPEYKKMVVGLGLAKQVLFPGNVHHDDVAKFINAADMCLALFDREYPPFKKYSFFYYPVKLNEYKACGKPIIASGFGNLVKVIVPKVHGLLVDERKIGEIADAIATLARDKSLCKKISENNRKEAVERYDWNKETAAILDALKRMKKEE